MKNVRFTLGTLAALVFICALPQSARAQAVTVWVSAVGDDANVSASCSRTAPCKTFGGAISAALPGGTINVIDPGSYGMMTITKAITVDAGGAANGSQFAGITAPGANAIIVNAGASDAVVLRGLTLEGFDSSSFNGINFIAGAALHVENCSINGFGRDGINFHPLTPGKLFVKDTNVRNCARDGIRVNGGGSATTHTTATIDNCRLERNGAAGVHGFDFSCVAARDSVAADNGGAGFLIQEASATRAQMYVESCLSHGNNVGLRAAGSFSTQMLFVARSTITCNTTAWAGNVVSASPRTNTIDVGPAPPPYALK